jgi:hypothetical protein
MIRSGAMRAAGRILAQSRSARGPFALITVLLLSAALLAPGVSPASVNAPGGSAGTVNSSGRSPGTDEDGWAGGTGYPLAGISCPSGGLCVAAESNGDVVISTDPTAAKPTWRAPVPIDRDGDGDGDLADVSCASSALCVVVDLNGYVVISTDPAASAPTWSQRVKVDDHGLLGVSCPSSELCVAVDSRGDDVISTDPTAALPSWSTPAPIDRRGSENAHGGSLRGVSCPSTELCVAVDGEGDVVISHDPTAAKPVWSPPANIDPAGGLTAVACRPTGLCVAVDASGNAIITSNAGASNAVWSAPAAIDPIAGLTAVSCPSTKLCVAVDAEGDAVVSNDPMAIPPTWSTPVKVGPGGGATGVSCPAAEVCLTVALEGATAGGARLATGPEPPSTPTGPTVLEPQPAGPQPLAVAPAIVSAPVLGVSVTVTVTGGTVTIRPNGHGAFEPLSGARTIADGSEVDTTGGSVLVTVATATAGQTQTAAVFGGRFRITQERGGAAATHFTLTLPLTGCPRLTLPRGAAASLPRVGAELRGGVASAARHRRKHRRRAGAKSRHLWVSEGGGNWGTNGRYVSTTVEGTDWLTQDECVHSRVRVLAGRVKVRNLARRRSTVLTAGQSYVAVRR